MVSPLTPIVVLLANAVAGLPTSILCESSPYLEIEVPPGYTKTLFYDDFSSPCLTQWTPCHGTSYNGGPPNWGTGEIQTYTSDPENLSVRDGTLVITPQEGAYGWTSARIETNAEHDFSCEPGGKIRIEARIRLGTNPATSQMGIWPAFWALGSGYRGVYTNWPEVGELDILESPNGEATTWHTVHCGVLPGGPCNEPIGIGSSAGFSREMWHVVSAEIDRTTATWEEECISWAVDGEVGFELSGADVGEEEAWAALAHGERFLLLNVAVGGSFPDAIAEGRTPDARTVGGEGSAMEVDYVAVYST